jgi:hypothetical protein
MDVLGGVASAASLVQIASKGLLLALDIREIPEHFKNLSEQVSGGLRGRKSPKSDLVLMEDYAGRHTRLLDSVDQLHPRTGVPEARNSNDIAYCTKRAV